MKHITWTDLKRKEAWDKAKGHANIATDLQDIVDRLPVGVLMLRPSTEAFDHTTVSFALEMLNES